MLGEQGQLFSAWRQLSSDHNSIEGKSLREFRRALQLLRGQSLGFFKTVNPQLLCTSQTALFLFMYTYIHTYIQTDRQTDIYIHIYICYPPPMFNLCFYIAFTMVGNIECQLAEDQTDVVSVTREAPNVLWTLRQDAFSSSCQNLQFLARISHQ